MVSFLCWLTVQMDYQRWAVRVHAQASHFAAYFEYEASHPAPAMIMVAGMLA